MVFRDQQFVDIGPSNAQQRDRLQTGTRYRLMQNVASIADAVTVPTDEGNAAFKIESARWELGDTLVLRDMEGTARCLIPGPQSRLAMAADILDAGGRRLARVTRTPISPVRDRFEVDIDSGGFWLAIGDVGSREFTLESPTGQVAEISRRWFLLPGTFGVEVAPGQDAALVLAIAATLDQLSHDFGH